MTFKPILPLLVFLGLSVVTACSEPVAPENQDSIRELAPLRLAEGKAVPNSYIITLKKGGRASTVAAAVGVKPSFTLSPIAPAAGLVASVPATQSVERTAADGETFTANLDAAELAALREDPAVAFVEQDQYIDLNGEQKMDSYGDPWGLDRIDQRSSSLSKSYAYDATGEGVYVYVVDTGIQADHPQFEGRAKSVFDATGGSGGDCDGHGTAAAGTIGGKTYGVAKKVYLRSLRVTDCSGNGTVSSVLKAIDWISRNRSSPAVVNMSISASYTQTLNDAVARLVSAGVFVAVAAGNSGTDACKLSPQSVPSVFTTAASAVGDSRASFSNYGKCVDGYAPGVKIWTAKRGGDAVYYTGTSIAAPHVAGVAALIKSKIPSATPAQIDGWIKEYSTRDVIKSNPSGTPNRLLFAKVSTSGSTSPSPSLTLSSRDIGNVSATGSTSYSSGTFKVRGSGSGIWNGADEFQFGYTTLSGDGQIVARVASQTNTHKWAKAGVMIRKYLRSDSPHAMVIVTPTQGTGLERRSSTGASTTNYGNGSGAAPVWVKLVRTGSKITGYRSNDGSKWSEIASTSISLNETAYIGLAVTSHNDGVLSTATFDNVRIGK